MSATRSALSHSGRTLTRFAIYPTGIMLALIFPPRRRAVGAECGAATPEGGLTMDCQSRGKPPKQEGHCDRCNTAARREQFQQTSPQYSPLTGNDRIIANDSKSGGWMLLCFKNRSTEPTNIGRKRKKQRE